MCIRDRQNGEPVGRNELQAAGVTKRRLDKDGIDKPAVSYTHLVRHKVSDLSSLGIVPGAQKVT